MNDGFCFWLGVVMTLIFWTFGPTVRQVNVHEWNQGLEVCAVNDGLRAVEITSFYDRFEVMCNNGAVFQLDINHDER
jgi:hypothetical protein